MSFDSFGFDRRIRDGISAMGYEHPTPIQQQAIPPVMAGDDVLGLAQTGTGKTAAFVLPIVQRLHADWRDRRPTQVRALVLAPTRELAEQIYEATRQLARFTRVKATTVYGGVSRQRQVKALRDGVEIAIATPGRLLDLLGDRSIDLSRVEVLVLDEADRMCDMGFLPDIRRVLKHVPAQRQTLFFSATMPKETLGLANEILRNPVRVQVGDLAPATTVSHALYPVPDALKTDMAFAMLDQVATGRVLIFTRTKYRARNLAAKLEKRGYRASALQGNMSQNARQRALSGFKDGRYDILVATDIAARGIDVALIGHVINFDMPDTVEAYTHRIGRTGRQTATGEAVTLAAPGDEPMVRQIEKVLGEEIPRSALDGFDYGGYEPRSFSTQRNGGSNGSATRKPGNSRRGSGRRRGGSPSGQQARRPERAASGR